MSRPVAFLYGAISYLIFAVTLLYTIGFVGNIIVPRSIDSPPDTPLVGSALVNSLLLALFGLQHSVMARPGFKKLWTRIVPQPIERSTYVLFSSLVLWLLFWKWQAMPGIVWNIHNRYACLLLNALFWLGWVTMIVSTFLPNHLDLFGLRQVYLHQRRIEYTSPGFRPVFLYRIVRHPINTGFLLAFWSTPRMTAGHLLFAVSMTVYIVIAVHFEERDLVNSHGEIYRTYQRHVPMLLPLRKRR